MTILNLKDKTKSNLIRFRSKFHMSWLPKINAKLIQIIRANALRFSSLIFTICLEILSKLSLETCKTQTSFSQGKNLDVNAHTKQDALSSCYTIFGSSSCLRLGKNVRHVKIAQSVTTTPILILIDKPEKTIGHLFIAENFLPFRWVCRLIKFYPYLEHEK